VLAQGVGQPGPSGAGGIAADAGVDDLVGIAAFGQARAQARDPAGLDRDAVGRADTVADDDNRRRRLVGGGASGQANAYDE
jgi:hypothetical protein